jgi:hypothetical protein
VTAVSGRFHLSLMTNAGIISTRKIVQAILSFPIPNTEIEVRIVTCWGVTIDWVYIGELIELQAITGPLLISTIHKLP